MSWGGKKPVCTSFRPLIPRITFHHMDLANHLLKRALALLEKSLQNIQSQRTVSASRQRRALHAQDHSRASSGLLVRKAACLRQPKVRACRVVTSEAWAASSISTVSKCPGCSLLNTRLPVLLSVVNTISASATIESSNASLSCRQEKLIIANQRLPKTGRQEELIIAVRHLPKRGRQRVWRWTSTAYLSCEQCLLKVWPAGKYMATSLRG